MPSLIDTLGLREIDPARPFLPRPDGSDLTYADLFEITGRLANTLQAMGVTRADRVAVQVEKSPEAILLYLACARAGAVFLPLNTAYTLAELEYFLSDAEPALVVVSPEKLDAVAELVRRLGQGRVESLGADGRTGTLMEAAN